MLCTHKFWHLSRCKSFSVSIENYSVEYGTMRRVRNTSGDMEMLPQIFNSPVGATNNRTTSVIYVLAWMRPTACLLRFAGILGIWDDLRNLFTTEQCLKLGTHKGNSMMSLACGYIPLKHSMKEDCKHKHAYKHDYTVYNT